MTRMNADKIPTSASIAADEFVLINTPLARCLIRVYLCHPRHPRFRGLLFRIADYTDDTDERG